MDRILTKMKLRRKDKTEIKSLPKNLSQDNTDYDSEYVLDIDRSITYDCKRLSKSYTLLTDSPKMNKKRLTGSASMGDLYNISLDQNGINNKKSHIRKRFFSSKPKSSIAQSNGQKRGWFSRLIFGSNKKEEDHRNNSQVEADRQLHVAWYASGIERQETTNGSRVQFRHSWVDDNKKELAASIAAELESKSRTKSLFIRNRDRLSIHSEAEGFHQF